MTSIPRHLLRISICLTGGLLALGLILVAAIGSAVLTAALSLVHCLPSVRSRASDVPAARRAPVRAQPATRAEPAI
jgi:hypothetical protein